MLHCIMFPHCVRFSFLIPFLGFETFDIDTKPEVHWQTCFLFESFYFMPAYIIVNNFFADVKENCYAPLNGSVQ